MKRGFTLAEGLITLGIIGLVAAFTIPTLYKQVQLNILKSQYKKAYATFSNNLKRSIDDYGTIPQCYYGGNSGGGGVVTGCGTFGTTFFSNLKVIQKCRKKIYEQSCIPYYKGYDEIIKEKNPNLTDEQILSMTNGVSGMSGKKIREESYAHVLTDGTIIFFYGRGGWYQFDPLVMLDINGKSKPNKWGCDIFGYMLLYDENSDYLKIEPYASFMQEKGCEYENEIRNSVKNNK